MKNIRQPAQTDSKQMSVGRFKELLYLQEWMVSFQRAQRTRPSEKLSTLFLTSHQSAGKKKSARFQTPGQMRLLTRRGNVYASLKMRKGRECGFNLETIVLALRFDIRNVREGERGTGRVMEDLGFVFISHFALGQEIDWGFLNWDVDVALYQRRKYKSNAVVLFYLAGVVIILSHTLKNKGSSVVLFKQLQLELFRCFFGDVKRILDFFVYRF